MNCQYFNTLTLRATLPGGGDFLLVRSRRSVGRVSCVLVYTPFKKHATLISNQKHLQKEHASLVPSRGHRAPLPRCKTLKLCWRDDLQILTSGGENIPLVRKKRITPAPAPTTERACRASNVPRASSRRLPELSHAWILHSRRWIRLEASRITSGERIPLLGGEG